VPAVSQANEIISPVIPPLKPGSRVQAPTESAIGQEIRVPAKSDHVFWNEQASIISAGWTVQRYIEKTS
jgi:hypothetical protein